MPDLSHFDDQGAARMVDVGEKDVTERFARAESFVRMQPQTLNLIRDRQVAKGDVLEVARLAGIMATKRTADLIPLCHPLAIDGVTVDLSISTTNRADRSDGPHPRPHRRRNGSTDRGLGRRPDRLRHVQSGRPGNVLGPCGCWRNPAAKVGTMSRCGEKPGFFFKAGLLIA